jgi:hypothetical protein
MEADEKAQSSTLVSGSSRPQWHENSYPWTESPDGMKELDTEGPTDCGKFRFIRRSLGSWGIFVTLGGVTLTLAILGFLGFLWFGEGAAGGDGTFALWRWVMLGQRVTQAITLSTLVMRIAVTAQASIYTSLIAAIMIEKHGVPLSRIAEVSMIRSTNDGPFKLAWLLFTSARKSPTQALLVLILLATSVAVQFSSTILVSDLGFSALVADPKNESLALYMTNDTISLNHQTNNWLGRPTAYMPFGEAPFQGDPSPSELGASDTGVVRRVYLPVSQTQRTTLRRYKGQGFGFKSRFVCIRPSVNMTITVNAPPPFTATIPFFLQVHGNISHRTAFSRAGLFLPSNCSDGSCFPTSFNCSLPQFEYTTTAARQGFTSSLCLPDGGVVAASAKNYTLSEEPIPSYAEMFLFFRSNGTYDLWRGPNRTVLQGNFRLPNISATEGEWITYERAIGGNFNGERLDNGILRLDMSMCFQQLAFDFSDVQLSTDRDLSEPSVSWDAGKKLWDTSAIRRLLGILPVQPANTTSTLSAGNPEDRGIFRVDSLKNPRHLNTTQFFTNKLINNLYNSPNDQNVSLFMDTQGSGRSNFLPHVEYQALFADILNMTNRPGVAMQAALTAISGSIINEAIPQFDAAGSATITPSVQVLTPQRRLGFFIVVGIVFLHMLCGTAITVLFLRSTRYSVQGNYWHAISQTVSGHTSWIMQNSTQLTDNEVSGRLKGVDPQVKIAFSDRTRRIQIVVDQTN